MNTVGAGTGSLHYITLPELDMPGLVRHAFTTRHEGLGVRGEVSSRSDWRLIADLFGIPHHHVVTVTQVHGEGIVKIDGTGMIDGKIDPRFVQADAMITDARGIAIGIETADCVPVLLLDPERPAVAAVHAGWRSTVKKIVQKTVSKMEKEYGADPRKLVAGFGPAIGPECYEVDEPVMGPLRQAFPFWSEVTGERGDGRWGLDLVKANKRELTQIGLREENIHSVGLCTACNRDRFYSFRAEGRTGRMLSVIMLKP
jgi:YfiH family protein